MVLKGGTIIDGTGRTGYRGDLLIKGDRIERIEEDGFPDHHEILDCSGKIVAPGFIDLHSHNDWFIGADDDDYYLDPFLKQGITTFVSGNCGFGIAGFKEDTPHLDLLENNLFKEGLSRGIRWRSYDDYTALLREKGIKGNLAYLAGSGTIRTSIAGYNPEPLTGAALEEYLKRIEEALQQGARGLSFGMGYAPDIFSRFNEQKRAAEIVKRYNGFISVHVKAFSKVSGAYPFNPLGKAHNLKALEEFIRLARETGVRLQLSHLIFVGEKTWPTLNKALKLVDRARKEGLDVAFDTYFHSCGATVITGILPEWFMAQVPEAYEDPKLLKRVRKLMNLSFRLLGFDFGDMKLAAANVPELERYNGLYLAEIAAQRGLSAFDNYIDIARRSDSTARLLIDKYSNPAIISRLMEHPAAHFMTDAWMEPSGMQNPAATGCFPGFIRKALDEGSLPLEECIRKMTGANAARAGLTERGVLQPGAWADITVFDPARIGEKNGAETVIINGDPVVKRGQPLTAPRPGRVL